MLSGSIGHQGSRFGQRKALGTELSTPSLMWLGNGLVNLEEFGLSARVVGLWSPRTHLDICLHYFRFCYSQFIVTAPKGDNGGIILSPTCPRSYLCGPDLISVFSGHSIICWGLSLKTPAVFSTMVLQSYVSLITFLFLACEKIPYCRSAPSANNHDPAWGEFVKPHLITLTPKLWGEFDKVYFLADDTSPQSFLLC